MLLSASLNCSRWAEVLIVHTKKVNLHVHEYVWSCLIYAKDLASYLLLCLEYLESISEIIIVTSNHKQKHILKS